MSPVPLVTAPPQKHYIKDESGCKVVQVLEHNMKKEKWYIFVKVTQSDGIV